LTGEEKKFRIKIKQKLIIHCKASAAFLISLPSTHRKAVAISKASTLTGGRSTLPCTYWGNWALRVCTFPSCKHWAVGTRLALFISFHLAGSCRAGQLPVSLSRR